MNYLEALTNFKVASSIYLVLPSLQPLIYGHKSVTIAPYYTLSNSLMSQFSLKGFLSHSVRWGIVPPTFFLFS